MQSTETRQLSYKYTRFLGSFTSRKSIVVIIIVGFLIYGNSLFNSYVGDDTRFIFENPDIQHLNIKYLFGPNLFNTGSYYRPIPAVYFSLLYSLADANYFFYHFVQVVLHITNAILLFFLFRHVFRNIPQLGTSQASIHLGKNVDVISLFLSLIFLVHPANVESVAYIASSQEVLYLLFGITALLVIWRRQGSKNFITAGLLLLLSMLSKETGAMFLLVAICAHWLFKEKHLQKLIIAQTLALGSYLYLRFAVGKVFFAKFIGLNVVPPIQDLSLIERIIHIPKILLTYVVTIFFPLKLAIFQQWVITEIDLQSVYIPVVLVSAFLLLLLATGVYIFKYRKPYFRIFLFFLLWFILGISMLLQIFPLDMTVADRWLYFPIVGMLGMIGVTILALSESKYGYRIFSNKSAAVAVTLIAAAAILLLSVRTIIRNSNYRDDITQQSHDTQVQDNHLLEAYLGINYQLKGNNARAIQHLEKSVQIRPVSFNLFTLAFLYEATGNLSKAKEYYNQAIIAADSYASENNYRFPNDTKIFIRYALVLLQHGEYEKAGEIAKKGLQYYPRSSILWVTLAATHYAQDNYEDAEFALGQAKQITSNEMLNQIDFLMTNKQAIPLALFREYADKHFMDEINSELRAQHAS